MGGLLRLATAVVGATLALSGVAQASVEQRGYLATRDGTKLRYAVTQLLTAAERPPHLVAIAPDSATSDLYRDVTYPGGILEYDFTLAWTGIQKEGGTAYALTGAPRDGDTTCDRNYVAHERTNLT